ncbi:MAG: peptide chain release factor 1 [Candidatus Aminicenantia bacterium]
MIEHLESLEKKYDKILSLLSNPNGTLDYIKLAREASNLEPIVKKYRKLKELKEKIEEAKEILKESKDDELRILAEEELKELGKKEEILTDEIKILLIPKDPNDEKDIFLEIRAGAGGAEATLFAQDLFRMYYRFAERKGWKVEIMDQSPSDIGGFKEVIMSIKGKRVWSYLKWESGVHRVQRVPKTESSGRIHTSTVTVAVLPEVDEIEVNIDPKDLKIEAFGASGPGGQNVNRNYTAIRITHIPTGIAVSCQDEKSQHRNREKAMRILRARLYEIAEREQKLKISEDRKKQVGTGERAEKIRTYNFIQGRVTDHRVNITFYKLDAILDGELDELIDALSAYYNSKALEESLKIPA